MTFELFVVVVAVLLFICGPFVWDMASRSSHIKSNFEAASGGDTSVQTQEPEP